ncbi:MAG TPA: hypothetical protein PKI20_12990 [Verrucomicrobiota bacterium]|jgi:hypothetical protein|nr:hypothetical protein [Verrucomicrobiota bacterium]HQL78626.1 hypothetical protein [Verrucomicrobiota bacterium]
MTKQRRTNDSNRQPPPVYALRRELGFWEVTYEGRRALFKHELGALYVACLLLDPPREPIHAVALALKARDGAGQAGGADLVQQRSMGLDDAAAVRTLWRRQRALERVLEDPEAIEPVKAEALRELEEVTEHLRKSPWRSRGGAERCVRAVTAAIKRLHVRLAGAVEAGGRPHPVLTAFARHLYHHLLVPSGRGGGHVRGWPAAPRAGCFTYEPPEGIVWSAEFGVRSAECGIRNGRNENGGLLPQ